MATSGSALGISIAIYTAVIIAIFTAFSVWRRLLLTRKFYSPNRFKPPPGRVKPQPLSPRFGAWVPEVVKVREADILRSAGVDAAMYIKILRMGKCWGWAL